MDELAKSIPGIQISSRRARFLLVFSGKADGSFWVLGKGGERENFFFEEGFVAPYLGGREKSLSRVVFLQTATVFPPMKASSFRYNFVTLHVFREWMVSVLYFLFLRLRILPISPFPPFFSTLFCRILSLLLSLPPLCGVKNC